MISFHVKQNTYCFTVETETHFLPPSLSSNGIVQKNMWECKGTLTVDSDFNLQGTKPKPLIKMGPHYFSSLGLSDRFSAAS